MSQSDQQSVSLLKQPKSVWAVAFACVIAFMGIGLVDPILPAISAQLGATQAETMLLFTSYLLITGIAMFFTSSVSSRIGAKRTLVAGLVLIVIFAALAGASDSVNMIIGFRAGWGLGNALFISTALATIVGAAAGGADSAIILYEALLTRLADRGYRTAVAGMTLPNEASVGLHRAMGFEPVGVYTRIGWKLDRWHDVAWMQRSLGSTNDPPLDLR